MLKNFAQALGQTIFNDNDRIVVMLTRKTMIFISISLIAGAITPAPAHPSHISNEQRAMSLSGDSSASPQNDKEREPQNDSEAVYGVCMMKDIKRDFNAEEIEIFKKAIVPYLTAFFKENGIKEFEDGDTVYQELRGIRLQRVDDGDKYLVHIEFIGMTVSRIGEYIGGLKGQDIVFLIQDGERKDFQDIATYYLETPRLGTVKREKI